MDERFVKDIEHTAQWLAHVPLDQGTRTEKFGDFTVTLRPHQQFFTGKTYTKEEIKEIVAKEMGDKGTADCVFSAAPVADKVIDKGCPLLNNMEAVWTSMGKVFKEYKTADTDTLLNLIKKKCPHLQIEWEVGGYLAVNGAKTNIGHAQAKEAYDGLKVLASAAAAERVVANVIVKKLKKLF